jgi:hypothetical protein
MSGVTKSSSTNSGQGGFGAYQIVSAPFAVGEQRQKEEFKGGLCL